MSETRQAYGDGSAKSDVYRITLPLPPNELRANRRAGQHWANLDAIKNSYADLCSVAIKDWWRATDGAKWAILNAIAKRRQPIPVTATIYLGKWQRLDAPDAGFFIKAGIDRLVAHNVFAGDSAAHINPFTAVICRDWKNPRVVITWW